MSILEQTGQPFVSALAWTLLHSLWQFFLIFIIWKVILYFTRRAPASIRYHISLLAILTLPVTFLFTFFKQYEIYNKARKVVMFEFDQVTWINMQQDTSLYLLNKGNPSFMKGLENYTSHIFWIYITGMIIYSVFFLISYAKMNHLYRKDHTQIPDTWNTLMNRIKETTGVSTIQTYLSRHVTVPMVVGFFKPIVLFPMAIAGSMSLHEAESILLHEYYHIRRKDHYINALQYAIEIMFFYHPAIWQISGSLRREREKCVDEWVVSHTHTPLLYAQALLHMEQNRQQTIRAVLTASNSKNSLLLRIKNIMHMKTRKMHSGQKIAAIVVILSAMVSLAWLNPPHYFHFAENDASASKALSWVEAPLPDQHQQQTSTNRQEPKRIVLDDGTFVDWNELSENEKKEFRNAMEELRVAMSQVNREVFEKLNSEEFKQEMAKVGQEVQNAIRQANSEITAQVNTDEFRKEMEKMREEIRRAMEEVNHELNNEEFRQDMKRAEEEIRNAMKEVHRELNSEEFRQEMRQARQEIERAMQEMNREFQSEEFHQEMKLAGEAVQQAMKQLHETDFSAIGESMNNVFQELGKTFEQMGPVMQDVFKNLEEMFVMPEPSKEEKE
jgi:beta-lactamase regulating signal transducer with metallopeptidase domain